MARKTICLGWELMTLREVAEGARILAEAIQNDSHATAHDARVSRGAVSSLLSLLSCRMDALRRAVQGAADPQDLVAAHNVIESHPGIPDPEDILLGWTDRQRFEHLKAELGRAEARLREARKGTGKESGRGRKGSRARTKG